MAHRTTFEQQQAIFLQQFKEYMADKCRKDFEEAMRDHTSRAHMIQPTSDYPVDHYQRFKYLSHFKDLLLAPVPLMAGIPVPFFPATIRRCTPSQLEFIITKNSSRPLGNVPFGLQETVIRKYAKSLEMLDWNSRGCIELFYQRQLRAIKPTLWNVFLSLYYTLYCNIKDYNVSMPHLDSLMLLYFRQDVIEQMDEGNARSLAMALHNLLLVFSHQMKRLWLNYHEPWTSEGSPPFPILPNLFFLQMSVINEDSYRLLVENLLSDHLVELVLRMTYLMMLQLFTILDGLPALHKLSINYCGEYFDEIERKIFGMLADLLIARWNRDIAAGLKTLKWDQKTVDLKVLILCIPQIDIFLRYLKAFYGLTVTKMCIDIYDMHPQLNLHAFVALTVLKLDYLQIGITEGRPFPREEVCSRTVTSLTLSKLWPITAEILDHFGKAFPSVKELNISGRQQEDYANFSDEPFSAVLQNSWPHLVTLRFTDYFIKCGGDLGHSIQKMLQRAQVLHTSVIFQVPVNETVRDHLQADLRETILQSKYFRLV